jgi:Tol biopolymer transport system component
LESLEIRQLLAADWQNPLLSADINDNGSVDLTDLLDVVQDLRSNGPRPLVTPFDNDDPSAKYLNANGNEGVDVGDALVVVTWLRPFIAGEIYPQLALRLQNDSGVSSSDGITNDPRLTGGVTLHVGAGLAGAQVRIDRGDVLDIAVTADGAVTLDPRQLGGVADGEVRVRIAATDSSGNRNVTQLRFALDTAPPTYTPPRILAADDTGFRDDDNVTRVNRPRVVLAAEAGTQLRVQLDDNTLFDGVSTGALEQQLSELTEGAHRLVASAIDLAGNTAGGNAIPLTIDTTPPPIPTLDLAPTSDSGARGDRATRAARVTLAGVTEGNSFVVIAGSDQTARSAGDGTFRIPNVTLRPGDNAFSVTVSDMAGNTSGGAETIVRTEETGATDPVLRWHQQMLNAIVRDASTPPDATRGMAMLSLAVLDTVNAIEKTPGYLVSLPSPADLSLEAAISSAALAVMDYLYPAQAADHQALQAVVLAEIADGETKTQGVAYGTLVGNAVVALRDRDGWDTFVAHVASGAPGQWQETAPMYDVALAPHWGNLAPFAVRDLAALTPDGPPALTSTEWADAYNEVKSLGRAIGSTRTPEQTEIARFWADGAGTYSPPGHWNNIAAQLSAAHGLSVGENARLFAMLNAALGDAAIVAWNAKYATDFWRPISAIPTGDTDSNEQTAPDAEWTSLLITPPFPEYVSGHSTFSGAAAQILTEYFGDQQAFTTTSLGLPGVERTFGSFRQAAEEASISRIYGGIHYKFSGEDGLEAGRAIADEVLARFTVADDTQAPRVVFLSPDHSLATNANPTVEGWVLDNLAGVASAAVRLDDGPAEPVTLDGNGRFSFASALPLDGASDGPHVLHFQALDKAGLQSGDFDFSFTLDTQAPLLTIDSPVAGGALAVGQALAGTALGTGSELVAFSYAVDGGRSVPLDLPGAAGAFRAAVNVTKLDLGAHLLTVTARDAAGNTATQDTTFDLNERSPFGVARHTPLAGADEVGVTFRPQVFFSRPVDVASLTADNFFATDPTGVKLPATIVPARDGSFAWLYLTNPMPSSATVEVHVLGSTIRPQLGAEALDADGDGAPGGDLIYSFSTVSLTPLPGTSLTGRVVDPGVDLKPMTFDDIRAGADGVLHTADDVFLNPIANAHVFILGLEDEAVFTDANGFFSFDAVPGGNIKLAIDGRTATNAPEGIFWPEMVMDLNMEIGRANTVMGTMGTREERAANNDRTEVYLPRLQTAILKPVSNTEPTRIDVDPASAPYLSDAQRQQFTLQVQPGSLLGPDGQPLANPQIGVSTVPAELVRDMLPPGVLQHTFDITIQAPGAATIAEPIQFTMPNVFGAAPGTKLNFLSFDHTTGRLEIDGSATVSADGLSLTTDPDNGITKPGWHGPTPPGSPADPDGPPPEVLQCTAVAPPNAEPEGPGAPELVPLPMISGQSGSFKLPTWTAPPKAPTGQACSVTPSLKVKIEIDGPLKQFMQKTSSGDANVDSLPLVNQEFTLKAGGRTRGKTLAASALSYDQMFGPNGFQSLPRDRLYGSSITVTETLQNADGSMQVAATTYFIYRWIDVVDPVAAATRSGKTAAFFRTLADGPDGFVRQKNVDMFLPNGVATSFAGAAPEFKYPAEYRGRDIAQWYFDPSPQPGASPKIDSLAIHAGLLKVGELVAVATFTAPTQVNVNLHGPGGYKDELKRVLMQLRDVFILGPNGVPGGPGDDNSDGTPNDINEYGWPGSDDGPISIYDYGNSIATLSVNGKSVDVLAPLPGSKFVVASPNFIAEFEGYLPRDRMSGPDGLLGNGDDTFVGRPGLTFDEFLDLKALEILTAIRDDYLPVNATAQSISIDSAHGEVAFQWKDVVDSGRQIYGSADFDRDSVSIRNALANRALPEAAREWAIVEGLNRSAANKGRFAVAININWSSPATFAQFVANTVSHELAHTFGIDDAYYDTPEGAAKPTGAVNVFPLDIMRAGNRFDWDLGFSSYNETLIAASLGAAESRDKPLEAEMPLYRRNVNLPKSRIGILRAVSENDRPALSARFLDRDLFSNDSVTVQAIADGAGAVKQEAEITLRNEGHSPLDIHDIHVADGSAGFRLLSSPPQGVILEAGEFETVTIVYDPSVAGPSNDQLIIATNDPNVPIFTVQLRGVALTPFPVARIEVLNNNLGGAVAVQTSTQDAAASIANTGGKPLRITSVQIVEGGVAFALTNLPGDLATQPIVLATGEEFTFGASFRPDRLGLHRAKVEITTNDPNRPVLTMSLVGTGIAEAPYPVWGQDYVALENTEIPGARALHAISNDGGNFEFFLPANTDVHAAIFDPQTGLIGHTYVRTSASGLRTSLANTMAFGASREPDSDGDGLPDDVELAIGSSPQRADTDGDGLDDFAAIEQGINPLAGQALPTGVIAALPLSGAPQSIVVQTTRGEDPRNIAYLLTSDEKLALVDVTQPTQPRLLSQIDLPGGVADVADIAVDGESGTAVVVGASQVTLVDVSDAARPTIARLLSAIGNRVAIGQGVAYVAGSGTLTSIDLKSRIATATPLAPVALGNVVDLMREGQRLYVYSRDSSRTSVLSIYDIANGEPQLLSATEQPGARAVVANEIVYLLGDGLDANKGGYATLDVSDPLHPIPISGIDVPAGEFFPLHGLALNGSGLGLSLSRNDVVMLDTFDPNETHRLVTRFNAGAIDLALSGGLAFLASDTLGLAVLNYLQPDIEGQSPTVELATSAADAAPAESGLQVAEDTSIPLAVTAFDDVQVRKAELLLDGQVVETSFAAPFEFWVRSPIVAQRTTLTLQARVTDTGGNTALSDTLTLDVLPDTSPFTVTYNGLQEGDVKDTFFRFASLRFSKPLTADAVNNQNFRLLDADNQPVALTAALLDNRTTVWLAWPALLEGASYRLVIAAPAILDPKGNPLGAADLTTNFSILNPTPPPPPSGAEVISVSDPAFRVGVYSDDDVRQAALSADGRYVAFLSEASNLGAIADTDQSYDSDVFVKDQQTNIFYRLTTAANANSVSISGDGRYVAFSSPSPNIVAGDTDNSFDVFVHDRQAGVTTVASQTRDGEWGDGASLDAAISRDGRYVVFASTASNFAQGDTLGHFDVFRKDLQTGELLLVSKGQFDSQANERSLRPTISGDGRVVAYETFATNLVPFDTNEFRDVVVTNLETGVTTFAAADASNPVLDASGRWLAYEGALNAVNGNLYHNVYLRDVSNFDLPVLLSNGNGNSSSPRISDDGRYVVYASFANNLATGDTNNTGDVFLTDTVTLDTQRISRNAAGGQLDYFTAVPVISGDGALAGFGGRDTETSSGFGPYYGKSAVDQLYLVPMLPTPGTPRLVTGYDNITANGHSRLPSVSADGRYVAFLSEASNLIPDDTNANPGGGGGIDVFVRDTESGTTERVSTSSSGAQTLRSGGLSDLSISANGRYVAFDSLAEDLVGADANFLTDVFVKDRQTGETVRASTSSSAVEGNGPSYFPRLSGDGRRVAFLSSATNFVADDDNGIQDLFVKDLDSGELTLVSRSQDGTVANGHSFAASLSADGRFVAFNSAASNLIPSDTNGTGDVFVKDRLTGQVLLVSADADGTQGNSHSQITSASAISPDGRYVVFVSEASNLVAGDTNGWRDVFVKDLLTGAIRRANTTGASEQTSYAEGTFGGASIGLGRFVSFTSDDLLTSDDNNVQFFFPGGLPAHSGTDVFVKDVRTGAVVRMSQNIAPVPGNYPIVTAALSQDARTVVFDSPSSQYHLGDGNAVFPGRQGNAFDVFVTRRTVVNSAPVATADTLLVTLNRATPIAPVLTNDTDAQSDPLTVMLVGNPGHGVISIGAGDWIYTPDPNYTGPDSFTYRASDGIDAGNVVTVAITVAPNRAPSIVGGAPFLDPVTNTDINPPGTLIRDLVGRTQIEDQDPGALQGIALTFINPAHGAWQYSVDGGAEWQFLAAQGPVSPVGDGHALLLAADELTRLRLLPARNFVGNATITYRAWDRSGVEANGSFGDALNHGSDTPFSSDTIEAVLLVRSP